MFTIHKPPFPTLCALSDLKQMSTSENLASSDQQLDFIFTDNLVFIFRLHSLTSTSIPKRLTQQELFVDKTQSEYSKICFFSLLMALQELQMSTFFSRVFLSFSLEVNPSQGYPQYLLWWQRGTVRVECFNTITQLRLELRPL